MSAYKTLTSVSIYGSYVCKNQLLCNLYLIEIFTLPDPLDPNVPSSGHPFAKFGSLTKTAVESII